jgi:8-oxo-dGTP diphosphatase
VPTVDVAAGVVLREGHVLVSRRRPEDHLGGFWEFPGGKIEPGETAPEAIVRELREELDVVVSVGPRWGILAVRYDERLVRLHFYFATIHSGVPRPVECDECRWVPVQDLPTLSFPDADRTLLETLLRNHRRGAPLTEARRERDEDELWAP